MFIVELNLSCQQSASPQYHSFPVCPSIQLSPLPPQLKTMGALALPSFCSLIGMRGREKLMSQFREGNYCCIEAALLPLPLHSTLFRRRFLAETLRGGERGQKSF